MGKYYVKKQFNPANIQTNHMILIEEDEERMAEESCADGNDETFKENTNYNNKPPRSPHKPVDLLHKPRAMASKAAKDHGIRIEVMRDTRVAEHLQKEPTEALNLMFYDFNNSSNANPYSNNADAQQRRC